MSLKKLVISMFVVLLPLSLLAGPGPGIPYAGAPSRPHNNTHNNSCYAFNRDGRTCQDVGFSEGQVGYPWGEAAGQFSCVNSCLRYVGQ